MSLDPLTRVAVRLRTWLGARHQGSGDRGATAVEYALVVAGIVAVLVVVSFAFGAAVETSFKHSCADVNDNVAGGSC